MKSTKIHLGLNVAIVAACLFLATALVQRYYFAQRPSTQTVSLPGVDFSRSTKTLLFFLRQDCEICVQSQPLYKKLMNTFQDPANVQIVLITPKPPAESKAFFENEGLSFQTVLQGKAGLLGVRLTPTLILVDSRGTPNGQWVGELSPQQEGHLWMMLQR